MMKLRVSPEFLGVYEALDNRGLCTVNTAIERLLEEHDAAWAREGRVEDERGGAWSFPVRSGAIGFVVYWDYTDEETLELLLLLRRA